MRAQPWVIAFLLIAAGCSRSGASSPVTPSAALWQLSGTVRCNGGDPIAGATLEVIDGPNVARQAATDARGRYLFFALEQAVVSVRASAADHHSVTRAVTLTSNAVVDFSLPEDQTSSPLKRQADHRTLSADGGHG